MKILLACLAGTLLCGISGAQILNPSFETEASGGSFSFLVDSGTNQTGFSAAANWDTFLYSPGVLDTNWVPAGTQAPLLAGQGNSMLFVSDSAGYGGIFQGTGSAFNGATVSCWVYVVSGGADISLYGGSTSNFGQIDTTLNKWVQISVTDGNQGNNSIVIGNYNSNDIVPSQFYVDMVTAQSVPEPASFGALAVGLVGLIVLRRKK